MKLINSSVSKSLVGREERRKYFSRDITLTEWKCDPFLDMFSPSKHIPQLQDSTRPSSCSLFPRPHSCPSPSAVTQTQGTGGGDFGGVEGRRQKISLNSPFFQLSWPLLLLHSSSLNFYFHWLVRFGTRGLDRALSLRGRLDWNVFGKEMHKTWPDDMTSLSQIHYVLIKTHI